MDALLLKIACEFADGPAERLEYILGHLRQAVQFWREQLEKGEHLPFIYASTYSYFVRFSAGSNKLLFEWHCSIAPSLYLGN